MMVNHNEFGITDEEFEENDSEEEKVQELLLKKMCNFITRHPEVSGPKVLFPLDNSEW